MEAKNKITFLNKAFLCLLAILVGAFPLLKLNPALLPIFLPKSIFSFSAIFLIILFICILIWWQLQKRTSNIEDQKMIGLFHSIIAYFLAFSFTKWALLKFCNLHMTTSLAWMEMPSTMLSGYQKVSHFYGQNYPLVITLGIIELIGAVFILFSKTRLLGAFILAATCVNILLIDVFFKIPSPISEAIFLLMGACYFIYLERESLLKLFFNQDNQSANFNLSTKPLKWILQLSAFLIPCLIFIPNYQKQYKPTITGKYVIQEVQNINNNEHIATIDSSFDYLYFDLGNYFALTSADFKTRQIGNLEIDENKREFVVDWIFPKGLTTQLVGKISKIDTNNKMTLRGYLGKDKFTMTLQKEAVKSVWTTY